MNRSLILSLVIASILHAEPPGRKDLLGDPLPPGVLARMGTARLRHRASVTAVAFSPDGNQLASGGLDGGVCVWEPRTGKEIWRLPGPQPYLTFVAFSPDSRLLIASGYGPNSRAVAVRVWEASTGKELRTFSVRPSSLSAALAPDGKRLACGGQGMLSLWDVATGKEVLAIPNGSDMVWSLAFSPDGKLLASGGTGPVRLWETATGKEVRRVPGVKQGDVRQVVFSRDGKSLAVPDIAGTFLWDVQTGKLVRTIEGAYGCAFSPDGKVMVLSLGEKRTRLLDGSGEKELRTIPDQAGQITFSPDGKVLAGAQSSSLCVWEVATGLPLLSGGGQGDSVRCVAFSPNGTQVASGNQGQTVQLWDAATGKEKARLQGHTSFLVQVAFSPDGKLLASGDYHGAVRLWDVATHKELFVQTGKQRGGGSFIAFSPDSRTLAVHTLDGVIHVWDIASARKRHTISVSISNAGMAFADGHTLIVAGYEGVARWDMGSGRKELIVAPGKNKLYPQSYWDFSRVCGAAACGCEGGPIRLWDLEDGAELGVLNEGGRPIDRDTLAFSADGRFLVARDNEKTWHLWELASGREMHKFRRPEVLAGSALVTSSGLFLALEHLREEFRIREAGEDRELLASPIRDGYVSSFALLPQGRRLVTGYYDGSLLVWDLETVAQRGIVQADSWNRQDQERLWEDLASKDAGRALAAMRKLIGGRDQAVALLGQRLRGAEANLEEAAIRRLLADLNAERFAIREAASRKLEGFGLDAAPAMRQALREKPTLEMRRRLDKLLDALPSHGRLIVGPRVLRQIRGIQVLEAIGTAAARRELEGIAREAQASRLTQEVKAALARLAQRLPSSP